MASLPSPWLAGVPEPVLARAKALLADLERGAALPSGVPATLRPRQRGSRDQRGLFESGGPGRVDPHPARELVRAVDVDRLTPLEALQLVARLKAMAKDP